MNPELNRFFLEKKSTVNTDIFACTCIFRILSNVVNARKCDVSENLYCIRTIDPIVYGAIIHCDC